MNSKETAANSDAAYNASEASKEKGEPSLTSTLTILQRTQLLQLLAEVTAIQRQSIQYAFKADATLPPEMRQNLSSSGDSKDKLELNPNIDPGTADVAAFDEQRKRLKERENELRKLDVVRLRDGVLSWYDEWRQEMIQRVGEVIRLKKEARRQLEECDQGKVRGFINDNSNKTVKAENGSSSPADAKVEMFMRSLYPPVKSQLTALEKDKRILILHSMLLILLSLKHYTAPSRSLLLFLCTSLQLPLELLDTDEAKTATGLIEGAKELSGREEAEKAAKENQSSHKWKVGLATAAGAAIIGLTGGLAAPLVAAGVGSVMGGLGLGATAAAGYLGSLAGSTMLVGGLFGAYGGRMTGQMMDNYAKEVRDFAFLPINDPHAAREQANKEQGGRPKLTRQESQQHEEAAGKKNPDARRLRITVGISGWLTDEDEVVTPWRVLGDKTEAFALRFDLEALMNLGNAMQAMVSSAAWGFAKKTIISQTVLQEVAGAVAWPLGLAKISRVVDNPFTVAKNRADKAGQVLADALINRAQGERPVNLVGYSLGARVVYSCLQALAQRKAFGLVDSAVLIGAPTPSQSLQWRSMRAVVSGRLVNVYSENDYVLGYLYRTSSIQYGVAGLQRVEGVYGIENIDVSETISGHLRYRYLVGRILQQIGWEDLSEAGLKQEKDDLEQMEKEAREKTLKEKGKEAGMMVAGFERTGEETAEPESGHGEGSEEQAQKMEKEVEDKTKTSLLQRGAQYLSLSRSSNETRPANDQSTSKGAADKSKARATEGEADDSKTENQSSFASKHISLPSMPNMPNMPKVSAPSLPSWRNTK